MFNGYYIFDVPISFLGFADTDMMDDLEEALAAAWACLAAVEWQKHLPAMGG